ncbi:MAG: 3'-5' exonuclease [Oscillospiraceae bacterium]|nr:3'-5' exonuclease [Oscillospiraceae bacterium]MCL2279472.1 3'-5' exonuclease [Oscillospiraceae bacterium]
MNSLFRHFDKLVFFDTETTGLDCKKDAIIEFAALKVTLDENSQRVENELSSLIELPAGRKLPQEITNLTGITEKMLQQEGKPMVDVCESIVEFINNPKTLLIAYNAQFDLCFLYFFLNRFKCADILKQLKMLDVLTIYKDRRDYPHKLSDAADAFGIDYCNTHRAIDDTKTMLDLLNAMEREKSDLDCYINLFGYNPKYGVSGPRISSITYVPQGFNRLKKLYEEN